MAVIRKVYGHVADASMIAARRQRRAPFTDRTRPIVWELNADRDWESGNDPLWSGGFVVWGAEGG